MISIVIPTMWRHRPMLEFLSYLTRIDAVKDIVIIDNDRQRRGEDPILAHEKIKILDFGQNIFVNPAFNAGVKASQGDIICFLNDDMLFDLRLLFKVNKFMTPKMGALGLCKGIIELGQTPITDGNIDFIPFTGQNCHGFGEIMFVHRDNWIDIPAGLDLGFGDNFIFERYCFDGFQNWFIANMWHHHCGGLTVNETPKMEKEAIYIRERDLYNKIRNSLIDRSFFGTK